MDPNSVKDFDVGKFLGSLESYARDAKFDYAYYLVTHELRRMGLHEKIGKLQPEHMNPILLFLRDWMPAGWVGWSEKGSRRWKMDSELCRVLNELKDEFISLSSLNLQQFTFEQNGNAIKKIFDRISKLRFGVSEEAISTVTSKIMHLLNPRLFVMWDTRIINFYDREPNADGYVEFMEKMKERAARLQPYLGRIMEKTEELRVEAGAVYGMEICVGKTLAKLIDENNWIESRKRKYS